MPTPCLEVHFPKPSSKVKLVVYSSGGTKHGFLPVWGWSSDITNLLGCLINHKTLQVYLGVAIQKTPHWIIDFSNLPLESAKYHLIVVQVDPVAANQVAIVEFEVLGDGRLKVEDIIPTMTPTANSTVCPDFYANGSDGPSGPPTSATMQGSGAAIQGVSIPTGVPGVWMYQFSNLANSPPTYTFTVTNGTDTTTVSGITVDPAGCPPPGHQP